MAAVLSETGSQPAARAGMRWACARARALPVHPHQHYTYSSAYLFLQVFSMSSGCSIVRLDTSVVNKIAAGEVIHR